MNKHPELMHASASRWLHTPEGRDSLRHRAAEAIAAFGKKELGHRLRQEEQAANAGGGARQRYGNSLRQLSDELAILVLAHSQGVVVPSETWEVVRRGFLPQIYGIDELNFQGRNATPPWKSDLLTADIAVGLACSLQWSSPFSAEADKLTDTIRSKCIEPIFTDWIDDSTRIHSLDTMGHNWWAVIVSGAGIACALLGDEKKTTLIANKLSQWFHFSGNEFSRKRPNFGSEGDFVEGFHYAEYALSGICLFAQVWPQFRITPDGLNESQARGLVGWLRSSYVPTANGWAVQRFSDTNPLHSPRMEVWHSLARITDDRQFLALAHELKPTPARLPEFFLWEPRPVETVQRTNREALGIYPNSGLAFDQGTRLSVTVRAGEFWNHNHFDAGTFIYCQDDVVWIDDAGTCGYGHTDYLDYFITPEAHNVAYAPALRPPIKPAFREGLPVTARYVVAVREDGLNVLCADTGILSGGALSRSYRWIFRFGEAGILIWDDFSAYQPQEFVSLLNTVCRVEQEHKPEELRLWKNEAHCKVSFFSDAPADIALAPVRRGEDPVNPKLSLTENRTCLTWRTRAIDRVKLGCAIGTRFQTVRWSGSCESGGWQCELTTHDTRWRIWFNPAMDGRNTHFPCTSRWGEFVTDAYALIVREVESERTVFAIESSFVRLVERVIFANPARQPLAVCTD
jgi:Heparinase II/III-like protein